MLLSLPITRRFTEDYYNSSVAMTINKSSGTAVAMYHPPKEYGLKDPDNSPLGVSIIQGKLKRKEDQKGAYIFSGTWEHIQGPMRDGIFEMVIDGKGYGEGWWSLSPNQSSLTQIESPRAEGKQAWWLREEIMRQRKIIQELRRALEGRGDDSITLEKAQSELMPALIDNDSLTLEPRRYPWSMPLNDKDPVLTMRRYPWKWTIAEPRDAQSAVRDTLQWLYVKNCVFCSWIFYLMTLSSLLLCLNVDGWYSAPMLEGISNNFLNYAFMIVYIIIYEYFLVMYFYLKQNPPSMYVLGVLFYTIGYSAFAGFYLLAYYGLVESQMAIAFNYAGSWCFLIGSAALIQSTVPRSWNSKEVFLLLGSVFFLLGSFVFVSGCSEVWAANLGPYYGIIGIALFLPGRLCFLIGSTSDECDILCRGPECQKRGLLCCCKNGGKTKDEKLELLLGDGIRLSTIEDTGA